MELNDFDYWLLYHIRDYLESCNTKVSQALAKDIYMIIRKLKKVDK